MKIIQLTDIHLVPEGQKIHEIDPSQRLEKALANIKLRHPDLDLLVITAMKVTRSLTTFSKRYWKNMR